MKIMFADWMGRAYDCRTPYAEPLGGTQSAAAYLAAELAKLGEEVTFLNAVTSPTECDGVTFRPFHGTPADMVAAQDVVIGVSFPLVSQVRQLGVRTPVVLWTQHDWNQPAVSSLHQPHERDAYRAFAMVSQWQKDNYTQHFGIAPDRMQVMRNAVSPAFQGLAPSPRWFQRSDGPVLAYTSTPFRGLDALLMAFALIRRSLPDARLRIYSGMGTYGGSDDGYEALYELARALPGVEMIGPRPQAELARAMVEADFYAYPSTFPETSCISAMEAMACGATLVIHDLGALAETTAGFAHLVAYHGAGEALATSATRFARAMLDSIQNANPTTILEQQARQLAFVRDNLNWTQRAKEWKAWLETLL
jgi:glycosyltransferase involved in cell wall biosynthesis